MRSFVVLLVVGAVLPACRTSMRSSALADKGAIGAWEQVLSTVVDTRGLVDYDTLEKHRPALDRYVAWLADDRAWAGKASKDFHAQYLNAYNALVLFEILEEGERPDSVLDETGMLPIPGWAFFHTTQFQLDGDWLTLSEIENERLRWKELDYRDHAAINCASMSCPPLRSELYRTATLGDQLDDQFRRWMEDQVRGVRVVDGKAVFNPIFEWYARDFQFFSAGIDPCTLAASVIEDQDRAKQLYDLAGQGCPRTYFDYDWSLNDSEKSLRPAGESQPGG